MSHDHEGQGGNPGGGRDEFDHFFSDQRTPASAQDPDATAWAGPPYDSDQTRSSEHAAYARPAPQEERQPYPGVPAKYRSDEGAENSEGWGEYQPADQTHYQPAAFYEEPPQRKGAVWAPVAVIVASLAIVAVVIAIILNNSTGRMTEGAFTPTATVTKTRTQTPSQSSAPSSSAPSSSSSSHSSSSSSSSPSYATTLPGSASPCPGSSTYGTGPKTSCSFAAVVATLYNANKNSAGDASFRAKSPETHDKYAVTCHEDSYVTCTTETGAIVYVLHQ